MSETSLARGATASAVSSTYRIYIAGDPTRAREIIAGFCYDRGDCYSLAACDYIYTGGIETGLCVTRINYPRFPELKGEIFARVSDLAATLAAGLFQKSYSIEGPELTHYYFADCPAGLDEK